LVPAVDSLLDGAVVAGTEELEGVAENSAGSGGPFAGESPEPHELKSKPTATADRRIP
jgi:hypothetical protein